MIDETEPRLRPQLGDRVVFAVFVAVLITDVLWYMLGVGSWGIVVGIGVAGLELLCSYWYDGGLAGPDRRIKTTQRWVIPSSRRDRAGLCGVRFGACDAAQLGVQPGQTYFYRAGENWREVHNLLVRRKGGLQAVTVQRPGKSIAT